MISSTDSMMRSSGSLSARAMSGYRRRLRSSKCSSTISTDTGSGFGSALSWMSRHSWMERAATPGGSKACTMATTLRTSSTAVWQRWAISSSEARKYPSSSRLPMISVPMRRTSGSSLA